jgi:hypothetical protein
MDLVYVSDRHYNGGEAVVDMSGRNANKSLLYKAARRLKDTKLAANGHAQVIPARVPIIKFEDALTGLQVDISFENLSGVQAQATFAEWKQQYPDMIYMVALMKQFLVMHGLNEVHTGGIGGYSIICLIVSYIQHSPKPDNLGECFLGFLKYYGDFDLSRKRIQMHPPAIVEKVCSCPTSLILVHIADNRRLTTALMGAQRGTTVSPSRIPIDQRTTSPVDPTRFSLLLMPSKKRTSLSKIACRPLVQDTTSDPASSNVSLAAITKHTRGSETT